jgi:precorrin-6A/cobalt-precorrin-6A reductase
MTRRCVIDTEISRRTPGIETASQPAPLRVLILGGTGEASEIAKRLVNKTDLVAISSLAGRINQPRIPDGPVRIGGFGGVDGLISFLQTEKIVIVIDATHPFAARISANAEAACKQLGVPLIAFARTPWAKQAADYWHAVPDTESAAAYVAKTAGRVFLAIGRQQLDAFAACSNALFLIRAIDPPDVSLPANTKLLLERGPFHIEHELQLLRDHAIDYIVSKNSGGQATYAKIEAARLLGIPVVMVDRPQKHTVPTVDTINGVLANLSRLQLQLAAIQEPCAP